ncbi:MAG: hypothetical protein HOM25_19220 [Rhodospirillaceae bacterium]|jgi:hypothetical protein|nr:hypothetical protein [Rhodospirillaceae bacterium]MBT5665593.1 hypothetical protein [Rhodospirillaceae bacterium]MBT5809191.1 hypothetical protein [Rhodospirillaceae bacterium]
MKRLLVPTLAGALLFLLTTLSASAAQGAQGKGERVKITGEVVDSWCYITEIMYPEGSAHHQCALWCAAGGVPVGILADDGQVYMVLKLGSDTTNVANPTIMKIQSHRVTVNGDLYERDGIKYLLVASVLQDDGIVKKTHGEYGIQPFGK